MPATRQASAKESSRTSKRAAGWDCKKRGSFRKLMDADPRRPGKQRSFAWINPVPLWRSRNDRVARMIHNPVNDMRKQWLARLPHDEERTIDAAARADGSISFLVIGDPGEGDASQFAVVPPLLANADDTAFLFVNSDVIYPAGGIEDYIYNFFKPYRDYPNPIYAIPGNHDWYDNCAGFMYWFCREGTQAPVAPWYLRWGPWRKPPKSDGNAPNRWREVRSDQPKQPGPYFAINAGPLKLVGIDTGITGPMDEAQGRWLRHVSKGEQPKILLTGKPLFVNNEFHEGAIEGGGSVYEVVKAREHNYVAAIGGDIHNYQRYPVELEDGRTLMSLVSGGGGAFMHATHTIEKIDSRDWKLDDDLKVREDDFRCYPLRGDSLSRYSQLYAKKPLGKLLGVKYIAPEQASALLSKQLHIEVTREEDRNKEVKEETRKSAARMNVLPTSGRRGLHLPFSEWLDSDEPPFFKHFLRIDADDRSVRIRCFGVSGCGEEEAKPTKEDDLRAERQPDGTWAWTLPPND